MQLLLLVRLRLLLAATHTLVEVEGADDNTKSTYAAADSSAAQSLQLYATALMETPNEYDFYSISGISFDAKTKRWSGITEGNPGALKAGRVAVAVEAPKIFEFEVTWERYNNNTSPRGTVNVLNRADIEPSDGLKAEGMVKVPCGESDGDAAYPAAAEYWVVSEANSNTQLTNSYFSKNFGNPDWNTFSPASFRNSRFIRVTSNGALIEEIGLPSFMLWDGKYHYDPMKCYGNRVQKGLHVLSYLESSNLTSTPSQLIMIPQFALYQDGPEPTIFQGSQTRILFWDIIDDGSSCPTEVQYSHSFRYETSRKEIEVFQKGAHHVKGVFAALAISPTELLVSDTEFFEGFGRNEYLSDVFYVRYDENATVDHCASLADCDVPIPQKRHLIRRHHDYELSSIVFGPTVEHDGKNLSTLVMSFEDDDLVGVLLEQYIFDASKLDLEPLFDSNVSSVEFLTRRYIAVWLGVGVFILGIALQHYWLSKQKRKSKSNNNNITSLGQQDQQGDEEIKFCGINYKTYIIASAVINSCLLGGVVFGFPALVLILRQVGVFAEVCSCGTFCSGQQEQFAMLSSLGFAVGIGSRLFGGLFLDKFGPKVTSTFSGLLSSAAFLVLATARNSERLSQVIKPAWIILALGGAAMHLTSFHTSNLQQDKARKGQASVYISAGFGAGSLVLPILQLINQYGNVSFQAICAFYAGIALLLTINCFFHQPWRAWNAIGSHATLDLNCFRIEWWPTFAPPPTDTERDEEGSGSNRRDSFIRSRHNFWRLHAIKGQTDPKFLPLNQILMSFQFWGECFWFSGNVFFLTYYLSTISQVLFALGDAKVNDDVDSFANNIFTRVAIFFNGFGFLWAPTVAYLQKSKSIYFRISMEISMAFIACVLLAIPTIELQILTFVIQAFVRLQIFSYHFSYLQERFGFRHFGFLNGISSLVAGLIGLCGYGLQIFSIYQADGSFTISYIIVAAVILSTLAFPIVLKRLDTKEQQQREQEAQVSKAIDESEKATAVASSSAA